MVKSNKRIIIISCIAIFFACVCFAAAAFGVAGWFAYKNAPQLLTGNSCAGVPNPVPPLDINAQMDLIESQVSKLRGLEAKSAVQRGFLTNEQLNQRVLNDFFKDFTNEDEINQVRVLSLFGLLDKNFNLKQFYIDLYSEQIAGFYDQETKEMYVIKSGDFAGSQRMTYAHEYTHVLQDQIYDIQDGLKVNDDACKADSERCAAITALLEGDASLTEQRWFATNATQQDCTDVTNFYLTFQSPMFESAPAYMQQDFLFPYIQGKDFVKYLFEKGGQAAVDAAYKTVPLSSEQILHPGLYPDDIPQKVEIPDLLSVLGTDWKEIDRGEVGEWYTYLILAYGLNSEAQLSTDEAQKASNGWGGDSYVVYYNQATSQEAMVVKTTWDRVADADEFSQSFANYANLRFGSTAPADHLQWSTSDGIHAFSQNEATTYWIMAVDESQLKAILQELGIPNGN